MRHFYLPSLLVLLLCTCGRAQDSPDYDSAMEAYQTQDGPGGAAIIVKNGEIVYHKAFGMASIELGVPMTTDNVFRIGSITKQFTAAAILQLAEAGKLSLDDDMTRFIPKYPTKGRTITIRNLLNHTSGIKSYTGME